MWNDFFNHFSPIQFIWGAIATMGGIARYLDSFREGQPFKLSLFIASAVVAGFSGWCFAQIGVALGFSFAIISAMAGLGGFFSDQTLKLAYKYVAKPLK